MIYRRGAAREKDDKKMVNPIADQRKREILAKLEQIQEQAQLTLDELPLRLAKDRLRLIIGLARYLSTAVDVNWDQTHERVAALRVEAEQRPSKS